MEKKSKVIETRIQAKPEQLKLLRGVVRDAVHMSGCSDKTVERVVLAVNEAGMNIIQHAYKNNPEGEIILEIIDNDTELLFRVTDFAEPVDINNIKPRPLDKLRPGGLGTHFINEIMDEVVYSIPKCGVGNQVVMKKTIKSD